ncbi:MAG: glycosyltransferase [Erysipelotrichaceae bacterium]
MNKIKVIFNGSFCGESFKSIQKAQNVSMSAAQENLEKSLYDAIGYESDIEFYSLSAIPVRSFPGNKKLFWKYKNIKLNTNVIIHQLSFINILILKQICYFFECFFITFKWCFKNRNSKKIFLSYSTNPVFLKAQLFLFKIFKVTKVILVSEIPEYRLFTEQSSFIRKFLLNKYVKISTKEHQSFDKYILMTKAMNDIVNINNKPFMVCEGMINIEAVLNKSTDNEICIDENYILYTGTLDCKYNILKFIDYFLKLELPINFYICGDGNTVEIIKKYSKMHNNIVYLGMVSKNATIYLQQKAKYLVNPRGKEVFTRFSFPSKILEYLATGKPTICCKLEGIPNEYNKYLNYIDMSTEENAIKDLKNIFNYNYNELSMKSEHGREFVLKNKSNIVQVKKIIDFIYK